MASTQMSGSALSLHGAPNKTAPEPNEPASSRTGILIRLNEQVVRDLQQCAQAGKAMQLVGGKTPKIRCGGKMLELNVKPETFRHEIYSADGSNGQLGFAAFVSHNAELRLPTEKRHQEDDAALEALKQSLASMAKQKEERKTTISSSVVPVGKSSKYLQPSRQPTSLSQRSVSSSSTPRPAAPTSAPSDHQTHVREKGMRFALVHLLAVRPLSDKDIHQKTHIPKTQLSSLLPKIAEKQGLQWDLFNKSYKELDPWSFKYTSDQRKLAVDHAIKAFDRARIPKDDKAWQILLPKEERNKGKILSRLPLTTERNDQAGTPGLAPTPVHTSAATTPKLGGSGTPRGGAVTATGRSAAGLSIEKRLKEAKKKGAMEKKKQEREAREAAAAASDRESKPRTTTKKPVPPKKVPAKVKSDEVVHSSDDEEEGEVKESPKPKPIEATRKDPPKPVSKPRPAAERRESSASEAPGFHRDIKAKPKPSTSDRLVSSAAARKDSAISKAKSDAGLPAKPASLPKKPENAVTAKVSTKAKDSPVQKPAKVTSTAQRPQVSPRRLTDTKPKVPSPLGTSPPRNASDYAEKPTKATAKSTTTANAPPKPVKPSTAVKTSETINFFGGIKPTNSKIVTKKRPLESDTDSAEPAKKIAKSTTSTPAKVSNNTAPTKSGVNGSSKPSTTSVPPARSAANTDKTLKRKANDLSSGLHDHGAAAPSSKHRKTDSGSTHSQAPTNSSIASLTTAPTVSPDPTSPARSDYSDDNLAGILNDEYKGGPLTWQQARAAAETFRSKLYPEYLQLYRRLEQTPGHQVAKEDTVRLWQLHNRLEAVKRRIEVACNDGDRMDV